MQNGDTTDAPAAKLLESPNKEKEDVKEAVTKQSLRMKLWRHLETKGLAMFPRPAFQRIPNFKGSAEAADRLAELDIFKNAGTVWVNPEKPQEFVRMKCLEHNKTLYVPATRQQDGYICRIDLPEGNTDFKAAVSRKGIEDFGKSIGIDEPVSLDMVVTGAVVVSKDGHRIGNGRGYSDLEFGLMVHMKAIQPSTVVVTVVHDSQVEDTLPAELFGPHDVPIDIIVTPTQVIETQRMRQRPPGLLWHLLSARRLEAVPVLAKLREIEIQAGRPCPLKETDTEPEERPPPRMRRKLRNRNPRRHSHKENGEGEVDSKPARLNRRRNSAKGKEEKDKEGTSPVKQRPRKPKPAIDFSVKLSNITPNTRVRDLKQALSERGVKPQIMVWKGYRGFCYLHFIKTNSQKGEGDGAEVSLCMESVLAALKDVEVREGAEAAAGAAGGGEAPPAYPLLVEPAPPRKPASAPAAPEPAPVL